MLFVGSGVKSTVCSSRGPKFNAQHPHSHSRTPLIPVSRELHTHLFQANTPNTPNKINLIFTNFICKQNDKKKTKNQIFKSYASLENIGTLEETHFCLSIKAGKLFYNPKNFILGLGTQKQADR